jgi:hypothetical protein
VPAATRPDPRRNHTTSTATVYARSWALYRRWCAEKGLSDALPAPLAQMLRYLGELPPELGVSGVRLRVAGLAHGHRTAALPWVEHHPALAAALRRRQVDAEQLQARLAVCGVGLGGQRDRLLVLLHDAVGLRPHQVAALEYADLRFDAEGVMLLLRPDGADEDAGGYPVRVSRRRGDPLCVVSALERWRREAGISFGVVVGRVGVHGWPDGPLSVASLRRLLRSIDAKVVAAAPPPAPPMPAKGAWRRAAARKAKARRDAP